MSFTKYPKNYNAHGYGWHNMAAMGYSKADPSISSSSSGVSSLYPSNNPPANLGTWNVVINRVNHIWQYECIYIYIHILINLHLLIGFQLSYGFAPDVLPNQVPNTSRASGHPSPVAGLYPNLGWNIGDNISLSSDPVFETEIAERDEVPCQAVMVPPEDMPIYHHVSTQHFFLL